MEKELSNLKTDLRSLVISCKQEMNISRLRRDYREHCGSDIPCGKFNYRDINSFLRERLSDVFLFKGDYRNPILIPIVPDSVKHIDQMVGCQTSKIRGPKRASVYESPSNSGKENRNGWPSKQFTNSSPKVTPGNSIFGSYRNYPTENRYIPSIRESGPPNPATTTQQPPKPVTSFKHDFNTRGPTHQPNHINTHPSPNVNKALPYAQPVQLETTKPMTNHQLAFADIPSLNWTPCGSSVSSSLCRESPSHTIELEEMRVDSRQSLNLPSSSNSSGGKSPGRKSKRTILRDNFIKLAQLYPDGIWATEFDTKYKEVFGAVLNFNALGYQSITLMCSDFPDCWFQVRPTPRGDTLILPKGCETRTRDWTSPLVTTREPAMQLLKKIESKMCDMSLDALPGIEFDAYPPNALTLHDSIEQLDLPESHHVDSEFEIEVGEVCSPTNFWYLLYSPNHAVAMYSMMNDMNDFYDSPAGDEYKIRDQAAQPAMYCAARYHTDWQRAMILTNCVNKQLKVRHIDFGTIANLDISKVRFLKREWGDLPAQALRGRLAKIRPHSLGQEWPFKATRYFLRLIYEKRLIASTCSYDDEGKVLEMFLTDTSLAVDIHVTDELIRTGLAGICREQDADVSSSSSSCSASASVSPSAVANDFPDDVSESASCVLGPTRIPDESFSMPDEATPPRKRESILLKLLRGNLDEGTRVCDPPTISKVSKSADECGGSVVFDVSESESCVVGPTRIPDESFSASEEAMPPRKRESILLKLWRRNLDEETRVGDPLTTSKVSESADECGGSVVSEGESKKPSPFDIRRIVSGVPRTEDKS